MFKRIGTSLLLAFTMLVSTLHFGNGFVNSVAYAARPCQSISECTNLVSEARDNIAEIIEQEDELNDRIDELNAQIANLRSEIENLELSINATTLQISEIQTEIAANFELLEETEEEIEELMAAIADRMRLTQRIDNTDTVFVILSESNDLNDFLSQLRFFNRMATTDADMMDQLTGLVDLYDGLIETLSDQATTLTETQEKLEEEQAAHKKHQEDLLALEGELREELYDLGVQRMTEEEALAAAEEAREILERTPPPAVTTNRTTTADAGDLEVNSGMTHPMPAGRGNVTSHFGPRSLDGFHWGIDWAAPGFPPILAAASGTVTLNGWNNGLGWYVIIAHNINDERVDTVYAHLHYQSPIAAGTVVAQGEVIGTQGNTGFSTGPHLHFEVHPGGFAWNNSVDPRGWISNP